ncbi:PD-(D/E)XK nuclease family protein [Saccharolobus caldissimus]|uniref:DUF3782 domain-containing protein n=1 Tax=Saccharolobus caldissimus TaxID=1702097 RepID=A0AAQ4CR98_9CREN|nr:PD-(D/E)XK nuclease family protein [Saccharolobus caldissimus]BDB98329.1 hypothetical protein SACC_13460 [Saccharolobus caldissimus]
MSLEEEIKKVLLNNPSILVDVLTMKPEIIYQALAKITPWQNLATKQDVENLRIEVQNLRKEVESVKVSMATKDDIKDMATKQDIKRIDQEIEEIKKAMATKDDIKDMATKQDIKRIDQEIEEIKKAMATKDDIKDMATKQDIKRIDQEIEEIKKAMATKDDIKRIETIITGLGARWGIMNEDTFREGVRELLKDTGWKISREIIYDKEGYVYAEPSDVEYDVVIKDSIIILIEITSSLKRGDLPVIKKKKELYEKIKNVKVSLVYVITPFIHDRYPERVKAMAKDLQIEIIYPIS